MDPCRRLDDITAKTRRQFHDTRSSHSIRRLYAARFSAYNIHRLSDQWRGEILGMYIRSQEDFTRVAVPVLALVQARWSADGGFAVELAKSFVSGGIR